jgi:hypothetical protein
LVSLPPTLKEANAPAAVRHSQNATTIFLWLNAQRVMALTAISFGFDEDNSTLGSAVVLVVGRGNSPAVRRAQ